MSAWLINETMENPDTIGVSGPVLLTVFATFMLVVGMLACLAPTLRGLRIRPVEALKEA